jgi:hypothetical protein
MSIQFAASSNPFNSQQSPYDKMDTDTLLMEHQKLKDDIDKLKEREMELRKYIVDRCFPNKQEGTNILALGAGYELKAGVKFNYKLDTDLKKVENALDDIAVMGNEGAFLADRLVKWEATFLLTEYREICKSDATDIQKKIRKRIEDVLTITEAAPTLEIKEPKRKK